MFLYTNNKLSKREVKKTIPFTITSKINLTKDLYSENYDTDEGKDKTNKWRNMPCSCIVRINVVKISIPPKAIYRFKAIPIKKTNGIFYRTRTDNPKICMKP